MTGKTYKAIATACREVETIFIDDGKTELQDQAHDALDCDFGGCEVELVNIEWVEDASND